MHVIRAPSYAKYEKNRRRRGFGGSLYTHFASCSGHNSTLSNSGNQHVTSKKIKYIALEMEKTFTVRGFFARKGFRFV